MDEWLRVISNPLDPIQVNLSLPGIESFLPVVIICGTCMLATLLWLLAAARHARTQGRPPAR